MKTDIILAGVGGQGILSIATIIGEAVMNEGLYIKQAEVHGNSSSLIDWLCFIPKIFRPEPCRNTWRNMWRHDIHPCAGCYYGANR